jgi:hypothetical protein
LSAPAESEVEALKALFAKIAVTESWTAPGARAPFASGLLTPRLTHRSHRPAQLPGFVIEVENHDDHAISIERCDRIGQHPPIESASAARPPEQAGLQR